MHEYFFGIATKYKRHLNSEWIKNNERIEKDRMSEWGGNFIALTRTRAEVTALLTLHIKFSQVFGITAADINQWD